MWYGVIGTNSYSVAELIHEPLPTQHLEMIYFLPSTSSHYDLSNTAPDGFPSYIQSQHRKDVQVKSYRGSFHKGKKKKKKACIKSAFQLWLTFSEFIFGWESMRRGYPCAVQGSSNSNISTFDWRKGFLTLSLQTVSTAFLLRSKDCWVFEWVQCKYD